MHTINLNMALKMPLKTENNKAQSYWNKLYTVPFMYAVLFNRFINNAQKTPLMATLKGKKWVQNVKAVGLMI